MRKITSLTKSFPTLLFRRKQRKSGKATSSGFNALFKKLNLPAMVIDEFGEIVQYNTIVEKYFVFPQSTTKTLENVCGLNVFEKIIHLIQFSQSHDQPLLFKEQCLKVDTANESINCDLFLSKIVSTNQHPNYYLLIINPRHENLLANEIFSHEQRIQTLGHLSGAIAHDFNNILMAISGFAELASEKLGYDHAAYSDIKHIIKSAEKASYLIEKLLTFARKQMLNLDVVNVGRKFSELDQIIQRLIKGDTEIEFAIEPDLWNVEVDPIQFEQIILNLILNAKQAIPEGRKGKIHVHTTNCKITNSVAFQKGYFNPDGNSAIPTDDYLKISIKDNGYGIKHSILHRIFDPFFSTKSEKNGTGLGLSTVFGIIKQSKGYILVKSRQNMGAEFVLLLPKTSKQLNLNLLDINATEDIAKNGTNNILLIEDEENVRELLVQALKSKGYKIDAFSNPKSAINAFKNKMNINYDLLLIDIMMPEMTGPEFLKYFQQHYGKIKALFISGHREDAMNAVKDKEKLHFLGKPFTLKQLDCKIVDVINNPNNG